MNSKFIIFALAVFALQGVFASSITLTLNGGSNDWWVGIIVGNDGSATNKLEIKSSTSSTWLNADAQSYGAWVVSPSSSLSLPLSVRITSAAGQTLTFTNIITSYSLSPISTNQQYGSSTPSPTTPPSSTLSPTSPPSSTLSPTLSPTSPPPSSPTCTLNFNYDTYVRCHAGETPPYCSESYDHIYGSNTGSCVITAIYVTRGDCPAVELLDLATLPLPPNNGSRNTFDRHTRNLPTYSYNLVGYTCGECSLSFGSTQVSGTPCPNPTLSPTSAPTLSPTSPPSCFNYITVDGFVRDSWMNGNVQTYLYGFTFKNDASTANSNVVFSIRNNYNKNIIQSWGFTSIGNNLYKLINTVPANGSDNSAGLIIEGLLDFPNLSIPSSC